MTTCVYCGSDESKFEFAAVEIHESLKDDIIVSNGHKCENCNKTNCKKQKMKKKEYYNNVE